MTQQIKHDAAQAVNLNSILRTHVKVKGKKQRQSCPLTSTCMAETCLPSSVIHTYLKQASKQKVLAMQSDCGEASSQHSNP